MLLKAHGFNVNGHGLFSDNMDNFNLLLELCQSHCKEVEAVSLSEACRFKTACIVRGVACSYKQPELQSLILNSTEVGEILHSFKNWGEEKKNVQFPDTRLLTALMPKENVNDIASWFNSAIVDLQVVHEPVLLLSTGNCLTGFHADSPPTEIVASLLRGRKLWVFASPGSKSAAVLVKRPEDSHFQQFIEDMVYGRFKDLSYCVQEPGDTVCFPARTVHLVLSVTPSNDWNCLLSHTILHEEEEAAKMETKFFNRYSDQRSRVVQGKRNKRSGVTKKRFSARRRVQPR